MSIDIVQDKNGKEWYSVEEHGTAYSLQYDKKKEVQRLICAPIKQDDTIDWEAICEVQEQPEHFKETTEEVIKMLGYEPEQILKQVAFYEEQQ